ncbi:MAG: ABC transporter permease [Nitrospira sp.]|nr:ABC transporter permease [Nitrospira sp.]MDH5349092.1 ABC transporter permease [Nitrospira sp.]MDH5499423.1 ABC transporter permease [Nitrospira sp.]
MESHVQAEALASQSRRKLIIEKRSGLLDLDWAELWGYRELLYTLVEREVKVRYKQTAIGVSWVLLQPLITMLIFTVIFGRLAKMPSDGIWYPAFILTALLPWGYFSQAITRSGMSLVSSANLVTKVYFPRILLPLSMIVTPLIDFALSLLLLFGLLLYAGIPLTWKLLTLPVFILVAMLTALGVGLILSTANVKYRDVGHAVPFLIQIWMFLSPIVYPVSLVPEQYKLLYGLNPMAGVIEGFRWALLGKAAPDLVVMGASIVVFLGVLIGGLAYFNKMERDFADVI